MTKNAKRATVTIEGKGTAHERERHEHDAFGVVKIARSSVGGAGGGAQLFGSAILHGTIITLEVSRAHLDRKLNRDWVSDVGEDDIVRVAFSEAQWAKMVSSIGVGGGVECTLERAPARGTRIQMMPELEKDSIRSVFDAEVREAAANAAERIRAAEAKLAEMTKPGAKVTKKDLEDLKSILIHAGTHFASNMAFVQRSFVEAMEDATQSAKAEIEGFVGALAMQTGLAALRDGHVMPTLIEGDATGGGDAEE